MQSTRRPGASCARIVLYIVCAFWMSLAGAALRHPNATTAVQDFDQASDISESQTLQPSDTGNDFSNVGDSVDFFTGRLLIRQTDLVVPGIGPSIQIERIWRGSNADYVGANQLSEFGDWALNVPRIDGIVPAPGVVPYWPNNRCSSFDQIDFTRTDTGTTYPGALANQGFNLEYGGKQRPILRAAVGIYPSGTVAATSDFIAISCVASIANGSGEGFQATLPDGTVILFNELAFRLGPDLTYPRSFPDGSYSYMPRARATMYATKVTDRFGNHIDYVYDANGRLSSITGSDGRSVTFGYTHYTFHGNNSDPIFGQPYSVITSMVSNSQTWNYGYSQNTLCYTDSSNVFACGFVLSSVTRPDGTAWNFNLAGIDDQVIYCCNSGVGTPGVGTITTPTGGLVTFNEDYVNTASTEPFGRGKVPLVQFNSYFNGGANWTFIYFDFAVPVLSSKVISGTNLLSRTWTYTSDFPLGWLANQSPGATTRTRTVTLPEGAVHKYKYSIMFDATEGELLEHDVYASAGASAPISKQVYTYTSGTTAGSLSNPTLNAASLTQAARRNTVVTTQDGTTYTTHYTSYDTYNDPLTIDRSNDFTSTVTETLTYNNDAVNWVIGQLASSELGSTTSRGYTYYPGTNQVHESYSFGRKVYTYAYNADGTLLSRTDGNSHATNYSSYFRGVAQTTTYADTKTLNLVVNADGTIHSAQPPRGYITTYGYDGLGRLTSVTYPTGDTVAWSNRTITYTNIAATELGMPVGTWRVRTTEGAMQRSDYYDGLHRLVLREEKDTGSGTAIYTRHSYDSVGRVTFESYPSSTSTASAGINTSYDAIGRETGRTTTDSVTLKTVDYLSSNRRRVKDAALNPTTYSYQAFGDPDYTNVVEIDAPESQTTTIARDNFGHITSATQSGVGTSRTRTYVYDSNLRPCKSIDPEHGQTVTHYDAASQVDWTAEGQSGSASSCDYTSVPATAKVSYVYSVVGRPTNVNYGDSSGNIVKGYDDDGHLTSVSNPTAVWTYGYNKRGLLETEQLVIDGRTLVLRHDHNAQGVESQLTYPDSRLVVLSPDAWGRPSKVGTYATSITYYPNGIPHTYTLGNGLSYTAGIDNRQRLSSVAVTGRQNLSFGYNDDGDLIFIGDAIDGSDSATIDYDDLHRVSTAVGCWGSYSYSYDSNNNILTRGGTNPQSWSYDGSNRLSQIGAGDGIFYDGFESASCKSPGGPLVRSYASYNARGEPTSVAGHSVGWNLADQLTGLSGVSTYTYDGRGKRSKITAGTVTEYAFYSLNGQIAYTDRNSVLTDFLYLAGKPLAEVTSSGATYLHPDLLGSPRIATNGSGTQIWHEHYDPFGSKQEYIAEKIGYTSHAFDYETGFTYAQGRYYESGAGRFLSPDSKGFDGADAATFNRFAYVGNRPYSRIDPNGAEAGCISANIDCFGRSPEQQYAEADFFDAVFGFFESKTWQDMVLNAGIAAASYSGGGAENLGEDLAERELFEEQMYEQAQASANAAAARATQVQGLNDRFAQTKRTTAVLKTSEGTTIIGGGVRDLSSKQIGSFEEGEVAAKLSGEHAEITVLNAAQQGGQLPKALGVSRPMCPECMEAVEQSGGTITSPTTAIWLPDYLQSEP